MSPVQRDTFDPTDSPHLPMLEKLFKVPQLGIAAGAASRADFAYHSTESGVPLLYMWDPREESSHVVTPGDRPAFGPAALHNRQPLLAWCRDNNGDERHGVWLTDLSTGETTPVSQEPLGRLLDLWWTKNDELIAVGSDAESMFVRRLRLGSNVGPEDLFTTAEQITSSAYDAAADTVVIAVGRGPGTKLGIVEPLGGVSRWVSESDESEDRNPTVHSLARLLAYTSDGVTAEQLLIVRSVDSLLETARIEVPGEIQAMRWSGGNEIIAGVARHGETVLRSVDVKKGVWSEPLSDVLVDELELGGDGPIWVSSSFNKEPMICTLIDGETVPLIGGADVDDEVDYEGLWYESVDGREVHGWLLRSDVPHAPLVVAVHGGPEWHFADTWSPFLLSFVRAGYNVFAPNYRGSTTYGTEFRRLIVGDIGGAELQDVLYGARRAAQVLGVKSKPAIVGGSYGGYVTLMALATQSDQWAGGVAFVPPVDMVATYELADAHFRKYMEYFAGGTPDQLPQLYKDRSPITHVARIQRPTLILHGENDPRCPVGPVRLMSAEAERLGVPLTLHVNADEGHGTQRIGNALGDMARALEHLDRIFERQA